MRLYFPDIKDCLYQTPLSEIFYPFSEIQYTWNNENEHFDMIFSFDIFCSSNDNALFGVKEFILNIVINRIFLLFEEKNISNFIIENKLSTKSDCYKNISISLNSDDYEKVKKYYFCLQCMTFFEDENHHCEFNETLRDDVE